METKILEKVAKAFDPQNIDKKAAELANKMTKEGKTLKQASGISDAMENEAYTLAKQYYDQGKYKEAVVLFSALSTLSPERPAYLYGLGSSYHQLKDYINASLGFYGAFSLNANDPMPVYYLADCFVNLGSKEDAIKFLDLTIAIAEGVDKKKYQSLSERCKLIKNSLISNKKN